jgi:hypothetical protein
MEFSDLARTFDAIERTSARREETITNRGLTVPEDQRVSFLTRPQQQCISC